MQKITLYKKYEDDKLLNGEKATITTTNGCTVTEWADFKSAGLVMLTRQNYACWGFDRVVDVFLARGYVKM